MNRSSSHTLKLISRENRSDERHASWLELFFDLVFVVAIAELAHFLHAHLDWGGIGTFAALFIPIWWLWIDFSYYADQFDVEQGVYRLVMLGIMFGMIVLALTIPEALQEGSARFAGVYAGLRLVIVGLYFQAWRLVPEARELTGRYTLSFTIALLFWMVSIVVPPPVRFVLWGIALLIEISNGPITYATIRSVPVQVSHMDERFGLFVIIVLGEAIVAVAGGVSDIQWQWQETMTAISGFITAVSLWWLYFECAETSVINQALQSNRKRVLLRSYVYGYSHVLLFAGIVAAGVGIQTAIEGVDRGDLSIAARTILCGGLGLYLIGLSAVQWATERSLPNSILLGRLFAAIVCFTLIGFGGVLSPVALMSGLTVVFVGLIQIESQY
ncbi:low temperature requirement protein A [Leptolyngbya sp. NIES-2104]|uniref:low temperature requirement protein A n=1 Tax=Leptolyngbya sp. NIES-2104 TaxID=1552121 RepID=UPI0006ECA527|nr:low temperature requirement protein A [Leptolyngbya sp. NIES-2104]GAP99342.1 putative integral membrane protein [Leptolyngbya sp. NIES-2104]